MMTLFGFGGRGRLAIRLAMRAERLRQGMANTTRVNVFNGVGCGSEFANDRIDYERKQQPHISQPRRLRHIGSPTDRRLCDRGFGSAADPEGLPLGCAGRAWGLGTIKRVQAETSYNRVDLASGCWEKSA